mgnify:CR=1 FL=1
MTNIRTSRPAPVNRTASARAVCSALAAFLAGAFVPVLLERMGADPAVASSVFVTAVTDVAGFFLLLGLATRFLL